MNDETDTIDQADTLTLQTSGLSEAAEGEGPTAEEVVAEAVKQGFELGNIVEDKITGLKGMATAYHDTLGRVSQVCVQPKGDGVKIPEAYFIDINHCVFVEDGLAGSTDVQNPVETSIRLGMKVVDMVTNFSGKVISRFVSMNGCIDFTVQDEIDDEGRPTKPIAISSKRLMPMSTYLKLAGASDASEAVDTFKTLDADDITAIANTELMEAKSGGGRTSGTGCMPIAANTIDRY